ncbi:uncharacterized protein HMPREF1541_00840 [Cyphellophora europaea CBS 101466]|uniref:Zn(2)-C6 fungal-type domain-containing protein n=1 Tax=Cyphellophora europaea (strain CBS 101466) TaxID=1220924 RepID=W2SFG8_CYPE1|nr:uncharacterized protein HMPREF1541_00840 [Cyphellophora europaea CBS 101466]ETN46654.1 hypothetical protein HMPREF1541_00840 [Cyphellophora europaea CBS 101466]
MRGRRGHASSATAPVLRSVAPGRSCVACRRRKIRCDRKQPCSYCTRLKTGCSYPGESEEDSISPRRPQYDQDDLVARLEQVEKSLRLLREQQRDDDDRGGRSLGSESLQQLGTTLGEMPAGPDLAMQPVSCGRLVGTRDSSRYVDGSLWTTLEAALASHESFDDTPMESEAAASPRRPHRQSSWPLLEENQPMYDLSLIRPRTDRVFPLWQVYLENVDPVLKLLHVPTTQRRLMQASQTSQGFPASFEALTFAIYHAVVTSMQTSVLGSIVAADERHDLLRKYDIGIERALANADFMKTPDMFCLQALTLYLSCARLRRDRDWIWTMTGVLVRLAMKLGLHRDPEVLKLSPFDCEMRRRLWWQIVVLDVLTAQDNDTDPSMLEHSFDTQFPTNVDDQALDISMSTPATNSSKRTDMAFTLRRIQLVQVARKVLFSNHFSKSNGYPILSRDEKLQHINDLNASLKQADDASLDINVPICFMVKDYTATELSRMYVVISLIHGEAPSTTTVQRGLVARSQEVLERVMALRNSDQYRRWVWLTLKDLGWGMAASLLHVLRSLPKNHQNESSWQTAEQFFALCNGYQDGKEPDSRWTLLERLRRSAEANRAGMEGSDPEAAT